MITPAQIKIGNRRLLTLATKLESVPRARFDFGSWVGSDWKGKTDLSCGTAACAMGWATTIPSFQRLGLKMCKPSEVYNGEFPSPIFGDLEGYAAASKFFSIAYEDAKELFSPNNFSGGAYEYDSEQVTPKMVARAIRKFVEERKGAREEAL